MAEPQNLKNHARYVPGYHFLLGALVLVYAIRMFAGLKHFSVDALYGAILGLSLLLLFWYERFFAKGVQDRLIRLEMRLRVREIAPALAGRFDELANGQVVALRFAGDDELAALMQQVLDGKLAKPDDTKRAIQHWKADLNRI